jgi:segregation and condensation protein A
MTIGDGTSGVQKQLDLQELVSKATWRELLADLVESNSIDPWDVDIVRIANEYVAAIRKLQVLDLHIPANMVFAASILLRMKSESIGIFHAPAEEQTDGEEQIARVSPDVPALTPRFRMQPGRKVTLAELMSALNDAMKINERREQKLVGRTAPLDFVIVKDDIDQKIAEAQKMIFSGIDSEGMVTYGQLSRYFSSESEALFKLFMPMLFLAHRGVVSISQDEFFGEIFIRPDLNAAKAI